MKPVPISLLILALAVFSMSVVAGCAGTVTEGAPSDTSLDPTASTSWPEETPYTPALFPVRQDGKWGYIDKTGDVVIDFQYDGAMGFQDGMAAVELGDRWGYVDQSGSIVVSPQFSEAGTFSDNRARVATPQGVGYIDSTGKLVIAACLSGGRDFHEGLAGVHVEDGFAYIDTMGNVALRLGNATAMGDFSEGLAPVRGVGWGYIDRHGDFVIGPGFNGVTEFSNGLAVVEYDFFKFELIDRSGSVIRTLPYDQVLGLHEGRAVVVQGGVVAAYQEGDNLGTAEGRAGYMNEAGELVINPQFKLAAPFAGGLAYVEDENGKMGYIDLEGNYVWREQ